MYNSQSHNITACELLQLLFEMDGGEKMPEKWTGKLIGRMHNESITRQDVANELGVGKSYVTMLLNGTRTQKDARQRLESAVDAIIAKRKRGETDA
jgi:transcriptional regulator with XRE-family HTH domain